MKTIKRVEIIPSFVEFIPSPELMEDGIIYISEEYGVANHLCLCGCKEQTVTPLGEGEWTLTKKDGKISLSPSIGNFIGENPYHAHYIITDNIANFV